MEVIGLESSYLILVASSLLTFLLSLLTLTVLMTLIPAIRMIIVMMLFVTVLCLGPVLTLHLIGVQIPITHTSPLTKHLDTNMRFRDRIKGRRQSTNVEVRPYKSPETVKAEMDLQAKAVSNPRMLSPEPVAYNKEKSNKDRALGTLGQHVGSQPGHALKRRASVKDTKPSKFEKDASFFKHNIKDN
jgi:hypothetical protein